MEIEINGVKYFVQDVGNGFQYYKIVNGNKVAPTHDELEALLDKLEELKMKKHTKEELQEIIKNAIDNNELTDANNIKDYLASLNVTEDLEELEEYAKGLLFAKNNNYTAIDEIRDKIIQAFDEVNGNQRGAYVTFVREKSAVGEDFLDIQLSTIDGDQIYEFPKMYCAYNDDTKKQLIEPLIAEIALKSIVIHNNAITKTDTMDYTADYFCETKDNQHISVKDIEQSYAQELEKKLKELCSQYGTNLTEEEVENIYQKQGGNDEKLEKERSDELRLVRKKPENANKGFANSMIAFIIAEVVAILLFIFTLIILL